MQREPKTTKSYLCRFWDTSSLLFCIPAPYTLHLLVSNCIYETRLLDGASEEADLFRSSGVRRDSLGRWWEEDDIWIFDLTTSSMLHPAII